MTKGETMMNAFEVGSRRADLGGRLGRVLLSLVLAVSLIPAASFGGADEAWAADGSDGEGEILTALSDSDLSTLSVGDVFQAEAEGVELWFTVTGDDTVAVGRGNSSGGSDFAIDGDYEGEVVIPQTVSDGETDYTVTEIQSYAFGAGRVDGEWAGAGLSSVALPDTLVTIEDHAFYGCTSLQTVDFAEEGALQTIEASAFSHCHSFVGGEIPASVVEIGRYAFAYCSSMTELGFAEGSAIEEIGSYAFAGSSDYPGALESFEFPAIDTIPDCVMRYQTSLTELTWAGESYEQIGEEAFAYCTSLETVTVPVLTINEEDNNNAYSYEMLKACFGNCTGLKTVIFADDVDDYQFYASGVGESSPFYNDEAIEEVVWMGKARMVIINTSQGKNEGEENSMFPNEEIIDYYFNVSFYETEEDAEAGEDCVGSVRVRDDASFGEIKTNDLEDEQIFDDGGYVPVASGAWTFEGGPLDEELIEDSCYAYGVDVDTLEACTVSLGRSSYLSDGSPIELEYTVTNVYGDELVEGVDYTATAYLNGVEVAREDLCDDGEYTLVFEGIGDYSGSVETSFSISMLSVDWAILAGQDSIDLARNVSRSTTTGEGSIDLLFIVGEGCEDYALACLGAAGLNDSVILVTEQDELSDEVKTQLRRTSASGVVLVGTSEDVSDEVNVELNSFDNTGLSVSRLAAEDLSDAATRVYSAFADEGLGADGVAYVVASDDATMAAAVGAEAYENCRPIFFCGSDGQLDGSTRSALKTGGFDTVVVLSDSSTAADEIETQVGSSSIDFESIVGSASEVSAQIAGEQVAEADLEEGSIDVVFGSSLEEGSGDAAFAALYAGRTGSCLLLAGSEEEGEEALEDALGEARDSVGELRFVGRRSAMTQDAVDGALAYWYDGYSQFDDVSSTAWYAAYVNEAVDAEMVNGYSDADGNATGEFGPEDDITRAQVATILYRAAGSGEDEDEGVNRAHVNSDGYEVDTVFSDEASGVWYTAAINWCSEAGILYGDGDGKVRPNDTITREELACMLMRYAAYEGYDIDEDALPAITGVDEADEVSSWATTAMKWAYSEDILVGKASSSGSYLDPQGTATRSQMAKMGVIVRAMTLDL